MNMKDAASGKLLWKTSNWTAEDMFNKEIKGAPSHFVLSPIFHAVLTSVFLITYRGNSKRSA